LGFNLVVEPGVGPYADYIPHALGFYGGTQIDGSNQIRLVGVPFWFLTLLTTAITFWVWRKTAKPKPLSAFPVELTGDKERN